MLPVVRLSGALLMISLAGCGPNYSLLHPLHPVPEIYRETEMFDRGQLRVYWLARYPDRKEPLPAVLIHPDRGSFSEDMEGICLDLAQKGYFAAAAHYQRLENLKDKNPLIPWKTPEDILAALRHLQKHPRIDPGRIAVLGFSGEVLYPCRSPLRSHRLRQRSLIMRWQILSSGWMLTSTLFPNLYYFAGWANEW